MSGSMWVHTHKKQNILKVCACVCECVCVREREREMEGEWTSTFYVVNTMSKAEENQNDCSFWAYQKFDPSLVD